MQDLRAEHFGRESERAALREVALAAEARIQAEAFVPQMNVAKAIEMLRAQVVALQLPPRPADSPAPLEVLARLADDGSQPSHSDAGAAPAGKRAHIEA